MANILRSEGNALTYVGVSEIGMFGAKEGTTISFF